MKSKVIHVMPKSMAMTSSGRVPTDITENTGTRKTGEWTRLLETERESVGAESVYTGKEG